MVRSRARNKPHDQQNRRNRTKRRPNHFSQILMLCAFQVRFPLVSQPCQRRHFEPLLLLLLLLFLTQALQSGIFSVHKHRMRSSGTQNTDNDREENWLAKTMPPCVLCAVFANSGVAIDLIPFFFADFGGLEEEVVEAGANACAQNQKKENEREQGKK